jgi:hypothetical protein
MRRWLEDWACGPGWSVAADRASGCWGVTGYRQTEYRGDLGRRSRLRQCRLLRGGSSADPDAEHRPVGCGGQAVHGCEHDVLGVLADPLLGADRPLLLAHVVDPRGAGRVFAPAHRDDALEHGFAAQAARLPVGGDRQMAPGLRRRQRFAAVSHRLYCRAVAGTVGYRLRLSFRSTCESWRLDRRLCRKPVCLWAAQRPDPGRSDTARSSGRRPGLPGNLHQRGHGERPSEYLGSGRSASEESPRDGDADGQSGGVARATSPR